MPSFGCCDSRIFFCLLFLTVNSLFQFGQICMIKEIFLCSAEVIGIIHKCSQFLQSDFVEDEVIPCLNSISQSRKCSRNTFTTQSKETSHLLQSLSTYFLFISISIGFTSLLVLMTVWTAYIHCFIAFTPYFCGHALNQIYYNDYAYTSVDCIKFTQHARQNFVSYHQLHSCL